MTKNWRQIEGRNPILEALKARNRIIKIFVEEGIRQDEKIKQILHLAREQKIPILGKGRKKLQRLSQTATCQGLIALAAPLPELSLFQVLQGCEKAEKDPLVILLPQICYQHNLGAVARTVEAVGADCLVVDKKNRLGPVVFRTSMGALEYLPIIKENLFVSLKILKKFGLKIIAAQAHGDRVYFKTDLTGPIALIIGSEDRGISGTMAKNIDFSVRIPMKGQINSLNLSVAASLILYEILRQRSVKNGG